MSVLQDALPEFSSARPLPILTIRKRDGSFAEFDGERIRLVIEKAFRAELAPAPETLLPSPVAENIRQLATLVIDWCATVPTLQVERVQDEVERVLMERGEHRVARRYVLYREQHAERRRSQVLQVRRADGSIVEFDSFRLQQKIEEACLGLDPSVQAQPVLDQTLTSLYSGITEQEIVQAAIFAARAQVEQEPDYRFVAARLLLGKLYEEAVGREVPLSQAAQAYRSYFASGLQSAVEAELITPELLKFDLDRLAAALRPERDLLFAFMGLQTLYDRYFLQAEGRRIELPQTFWMRVAMGLALNEADREARAIEFYDLISQFRFTPATPTLFNSGTLHSQLSSCYLTTVPDDLFAIFKCVQDNAMLSKWAGGLGNDWTPVRALGAHIKGTNGKSQGIIPFLKLQAAACPRSPAKTPSRWS